MVANPHLYEERAGIYAKSRSFTFYEEVHAEKLFGNSNIQKTFLEILKSMLPPKTHLIIIADAGFKTDFFQAILSLHWYFIVRIRSNMLFEKKHQAWIPCPEFYQGATSMPRYLGEGFLLNKSTKTLAYLYYIKVTSQGKNKKRRKNATQSKLYSKRHRQPWLIASSLKKFAWIIESTEAFSRISRLLDHSIPTF